MGSLDGLLNNEGASGSNIATALGEVDVPVILGDGELEGGGAPHAGDPVVQVILGVGEERVKRFKGAFHVREVEGLGQAQVREVAEGLLLDGCEEAVASIRDKCHEEVNPGCTRLGEIGVQESVNAVNRDGVGIANNDIGVGLRQGEGEHGEVALDREEFRVGGPNRVEQIGVKGGERHGG